MVDLYKQTSKGHDFSYTLKQNTEHMTYDEVELRHTNDKVDRKNLAFTYENFTETPFWDTLKSVILIKKSRLRQEQMIIAMGMTNVPWREIRLE